MRNANIKYTGTAKDRDPCAPRSDVRATVMRISPPAKTTLYEQQIHSPGHCKRLHVHALVFFYLIIPSPAQQALSLLSHAQASILFLKTYNSTVSGHLAHKTTNV